ncbi:MAG: hypothetical protein NTU57_03090 [Candidatus Aenigmarchaeota archaeon]|nr:hypothetical protein [Candidatus Aenigmarchaeota archaeon]
MRNISSELFIGELRAKAGRVPGICGPSRALKYNPREEHFGNNIDSTC